MTESDWTDLGAQWRQNEMAAALAGAAAILILAVELTGAGGARFRCPLWTSRPQR